MKPRDGIAVINSRIPIADDIVEITLKLRKGDQERGAELSPPDFATPLPGQFAHVAIPGNFLRRPISIAGYNEESRTLRLIVQRVGRGSETLTELPLGSELRVLLPLGNPFPFPVGMIGDIAVPVDKVWIVAGGIGLAPMLFAAKYAYGSVQIDSFVGFRDEVKVFGVSELETCGKCEVSVGGLITEPLLKALNGERPDLLFACGPEPMLRALQKICADHRLTAYASLEEHMGCGMGACLVCNCGIKSSEGFSYRRVCADGPVFDLSEVAFK
jgi:dihydroorotate dehydrogenase electron transfer subunit